MTSANRRRAVQVRRRLRRGTYLLPSLFTMGNVMLGFAAIVRGLDGDFRDAAILIVFAVFLDGLDGRIARLTGTESEFGKELDSLADVISFGAAPALLAFLWGLQEYGRIGWLVPLYFLICTAVRLARFNVQTKKVDPKSFVGLPSPAAAGTVCWLLFLSSEWFEIPPKWLEALMLVALVVVGTLMVSTFRYPSLKKIDLRRKVSYRVVAMLLAAGILVVAVRPAILLLSAALVYTLAGPAGWLFSRLRRRPPRLEPEPETDPPS